MSRNSILIVLFSVLFALDGTTEAMSIHSVRQYPVREFQDKHNKLVALRMQHIKNTVELTAEEENKLNTALISLDKSRFSIWKQSMQIRKDLESQKTLTDEEAMRHLEKLIALDQELENTHISFFKSLEKLGFSPQQRLRIYISLKKFHGKMGKFIRD